MNLALLYERQGRLGEALDIYQAIDFSSDVAYMIDVRMTTTQLRQYVDDHPRAKNQNLLNLSLGFRYLRDHRWNAAKSAFLRVPRSKRISMVNNSSIVDREDSELPLQDPFKTANELRVLSNRAEALKPGLKKSQALMNLAGYYYNHHDYLLYNGALWRGDRQYAIEFSWNPDIASAADDKALDDHHWKHECFAQALIICRRIIHDYPGTSIASRAAYRGAAAADHLSRFSEYWRWKNSRINLVGESIKLMRLAEKSPNSWIAARARKYAGVFVDQMAESKSEDDSFDSIKQSKRYLGQPKLSSEYNSGK